MTDIATTYIKLTRQIDNGSKRIEFEDTDERNIEQFIQQEYKVAASGTLTLPLGSSAESGLLLMKLSHRMTLKGDAGDVGIKVGPGLVSLPSPDDSQGNDSILLVAGSEITTVNYFSAKVVS